MAQSRKRQRTSSSPVTTPDPPLPNTRWQLYGPGTGGGKKKSVDKSLKKKEEKKEPEKKETRPAFVKGSHSKATSSSSSSSSTRVAWQEAGDSRRDSRDAGHRWRWPGPRQAKQTVAGLSLSLSPWIGSLHLWPAIINERPRSRNDPSAPKKKRPNQQISSKKSDETHNNNNNNNNNNNQKEAESTGTRPFHHQLRLRLKNR